MVVVSVWETGLSPYPVSALPVLPPSDVDPLLGCQIEIKLEPDLWCDVQAPRQPESRGRVQTHLVVPGPPGDGALEALVAPLLPAKWRRLVVEHEFQINAGSKSEKPRKNHAGN